MNIFVSGLNYSITSEELQEVFAPFGEITAAKVIMDRATGRSRGFGFVEMPNSEEGRTAIERLDQSEVNGRKINVKEAEERAARPSGGDRPRGNFGGGGRREGGFRPRFNRDNDGGGYNRDRGDRGSRY